MSGTSAIEIWGHRGESIRHPENTLRAFSAAMECGAQGIELDIQKSADGHFVVIHDELLNRSTNGSGPVGKKSLRELKSLDAGDGEKIPELREVLELLTGYSMPLIDVELKKESLKVEDFEALQAILKPYEGLIRILITSFEHRLLVPFSRAGYSTGLLIGEEHEADGIRGILRSIRVNRPTHLSLPYELHERFGILTLSLAFLLIRLKGLKIAFWTVNSPEEFHRVRRVASAIISDDPALMLSLAGRKGVGISQVSGNTR